MKSWEKNQPSQFYCQLQDTTVWAVVTKKDSWEELLDHGTDWRRGKGLQGSSEHRKIKASHFLRKFVNPNSFVSISSFNMIAAIQSFKNNTVCASPQIKYACRKDSSFFFSFFFFLFSVLREVGVELTTLWDCRCVSSGLAVSGINLTYSLNSAIWLAISQLKIMLTAFKSYFASWKLDLICGS